MRFTVQQNRRCLRGLHFEYHLERDVDALDLFDGIEARLGPLVRHQDPLGERLTHRGILPFRFEVRVGVKPRLVDFLHRASASEDERSVDRDTLESVLVALPGLPTTRQETPALTANPR